MKTVLKENPDTVSSGERMVASCSENNIGFIVFQFMDTKKVEVEYTDQGYANHSKVRVKIEKKYPDSYDDSHGYNRPYNIKELIRGRIWPNKDIASIYEKEETAIEYSDIIEKLFTELDLNITEFWWDFSGSSTDELKKWPGKSASFSKSKELDDKTRDEIDKLIQQLHLARPDEKINIRKKIKDLQNSVGIEDGEIEQRVRASYAKQTSIQGNYGSVAQANYARGSIAESKFRIYNKTMDTKLWNDLNLKPEIRKMLLKIAQDFFKNTELKTNIVDILLLGSAANYNWTPTSDLDLHIVIDASKENIDVEHSRAFFDGLAAKWNNSHAVEIKGHPVEVYVQDVKEKNSSPELSREGASMFSLLKNQWLKKPENKKPDVDADKIKQKYHKIKSMIDGFISQKNIDKLKSLMKAIRKYRDAGLSKGGEFGTENLVFKALRHTGELEKLKDAVNSIYDKSVSITELKKSP